MSTQAITHFTDKYGFLSNFAYGNVTYDGVVYKTVEHAYQAAKTLVPEEREFIRELPTPGKVKRASRKLTMRPDWDSMKLGIMEDLLRQKFSQDPYRRWLLATGDAELIEGNDWGDTYWGKVSVGEDFSGPWEGENHLGRLLMQIRSELK